MTSKSNPIDTDAIDGGGEAPPLLGNLPIRIASRWPITIMTVTLIAVSAPVVAVLAREWSATCADCPHDCGCGVSDCYCGDGQADRLLRGELRLRGSE